MPIFRLVVRTVEDQYCYVEADNEHGAQQQYLQALDGDGVLEYTSLDVISEKLVAIQEWKN